jgi:hypothetical protein
MLLAPIEDEEGLDVVFEGVVKNSIMDHVVPHYDQDAVNPRVQLQPDRVRAEYTALYETQLQHIIEGYNIICGDEKPISFNSTLSDRPKKKGKGTRDSSSGQPLMARHVQGLFPTNSPAAKYSNWKAAQTILKGGTNIQHPHCDTAIVNSYANLDVFPFVGIHGFGEHEFTMWLLPNPLARHYGFEHTFNPKNLLLMRGDFVHAGAPGLHPRGHFAFLPKEAAGWTRERSFWNLRAPTKVQPTFLWQKPTYPFGFPSARDPTSEGDIVIIYPPSLTKILKTPFTQKQCKAEGMLYLTESKRIKRQRREECAKVQSQSW